MKRWIAIVALVILLVVLALTVRAWLPPLLAFVGTNTDLIQGLADATQIVLWLGAATVALISFLRSKPKPTPAREQTDTTSRPDMTGPGVKAGRDQIVQGDLIAGDKIGREINTGGGAYVGGNVRVGRDFVGRDQVISGDGNVLTGGGDFLGGDLTVVITEAVAGLLRTLGSQLPKEALQQATEAYYGSLLDYHRYLNMRGMGISDRVPLKLPLLDLYVPLKARVELPEGETWQRALRLAGRQLPEGEAVELAGRLSEPRPVLELLQRHAGLIILGDPGAGKTTFLKFLALKLALGEGGALGLGERLPVLAPLSEYANRLNEGGRLLRLDDFISQHVHDSGSNLPFGDMLAAALDAGQALILLDGLDEVKDLALRETIVRQVTAFYSHHRQKGNKFVLTSRVVGYREARLTADGLAECTLVDFDDDEIAAFVARWTAALERQAQGEGNAAYMSAERERRELLDAIHRNVSVRQLAANPLLLTILALMKRQGVTLPERRVELYDQYVKTLLSVWNRARGLGRPPAHDLDVLETVRVLAPLALWMHEVNPGVGLVKREDLRRKLVEIYTQRGEPHPQVAAERFLTDVRDYAGLLVERGAGQYGFIHLTFEEYLDAVAIGQAGQGSCRPILDRLAGHVGDASWREVAVLTVGYVGIIQQLDRVAGDVVEALVREQPGAAGEAVVLAGEAVLDAWPGGVPATSKAKAIDALVPTMQDAAVSPPLRRQAGLLLGRLGWLPADLDAFLPVPAGEFLYGENKEKRHISHHYWIGKYPVTNAQYARFINDRGYERREWWSKAGWQWLQGSERKQPAWWDDQEESNPIFPVVGVSWYEAEAYVNWLNSRAGDLQLGEPLPTGYRLRLPTEEEWERAARGMDGCEYPWVGDFDFARANVAEEIGKGMGATAVCTYPQGISPAGAWDMSGNVWEWTCSLWSESDKWPVLRGGSWSNDRRLARCASRDGYLPDFFYGYFGFRVVVSLSDSGF